MRKYLLVLIAMLATPGFGGVALWLENDVLNSSDTYYTHGTRLLYTDAADMQGWCMGQLMYTPSDISIAAPQPDDRPWAGWLYAGHVWYGSGYLYEATIGIVGPHSYAGDVQRWVHKNVPGNTYPAGWGNQIQDELAINVFAEHDVWAYRDGKFTTRLYAIGALGNVLTAAGSGLRATYGSPLMTSMLDTIPITAQDNAHFDWSVHAGVECRAVLWNVFLDGNLTRDSHSVDPEFFVADFEIGAAIRLYSVRLGFTRTVRSREFETQRSSSETFDSLMLYYTF